MNGPPLPQAATEDTQQSQQLRGRKGRDVISWLRQLARHKNSDNLRDAIEDYMEELDQAGTNDAQTVLTHERKIIGNVLTLRDKTVVDVMIPRADIIAIDVNATRDDLVKLIEEKQHSRIPVYRGTLDDILGTIHIKDVLSRAIKGEHFTLQDLVRDVPIVSPALPVLDLILQMQTTKRHMVMVVDEYGGIDGLVTIGDLIESIIGAIEDEYGQDDAPRITQRADGSMIIDARYEISSFEDTYGPFLTDDEREQIDTFGGLVFALTGRVPARGEVLAHETSGMTLEILDADPRRVYRIRIQYNPAEAQKIRDVVKDSENIRAA